MPAPDARTVRRIATRLLIAGTVLAIVYGVARFGLITFPPSYDAMTPTFPLGGGRVVIDRWPDRARPLESTRDILLYRAPVEGRMVTLMGRLRGLPGAVIGRRGDRMTIDGHATDFAPGVLRDGPIPADLMLILNENAQSALPDGRTVGLIRRRHLVGRVVVMFPTGQASTPIE